MAQGGIVPEGGGGVNKMCTNPQRNLNLALVRVSGILADNTMKRLLLGLIFGLLAVGALADSFSLKDGSKVVGKVISSDAGSVTVQSESLGTLTIHREQLQALETPKPSPASPKPWSGTITGGYQRTQNSKLTDDVNLGFFCQSRRQGERTLSSRSLSILGRQRQERETQRHQ